MSYSRQARRKNRHRVKAKGLVKKYNRQCDGARVTLAQINKAIEKADKYDKDTISASKPKKTLLQRLGFG